MRRKLMLVIGLMVVSGIAFSQTRNDFKGPRAKNYKAWKYSVETTSVEIVTNQEEVKRGPKAKNRKRSLSIVNRTDEATRAPSESLLRNERLGMVGPEAKNYKIGRK